MSVTKEIIEQERLLVQTGHHGDLHLHREGTFMRAYDWSAWLACHLLHDFKVSKRALARIVEKLPNVADCESQELLRSTLNSFIGLLSHYQSYKIRRNAFTCICGIYKHGYFLSGIRKFMLYGMG